MKEKNHIIDFNCETRMVSGTIELNKLEFDELEAMEIAEMVVRVIESWCKTRDFKHNNLDLYKYAIN
jgi:hypothetical protein